MKLMVLFLATLSYSNGKTYRSYSSGVNYQEAVIYCKDKGQEIATATTKQDYIDLDNFCKDYCNSESYWIGLGYNSTANNFQWSDGTLLDVEYWRSNEPDRQNAEKCAYLRCDDMKWRTTSCTTVLRFVCIDFSENPNYTFHADYLTHDEASKRCLQNNGGLPIIRTPIDRSNLRDFLNTQNIQGSEEIWIGLKKKTNDDTYRWINGVELGDFYRWSTEDAENSYVHLHYGSNGIYFHSTSNSDRRIICQDRTTPVIKKRPTDYYLKVSSQAFPLGKPRGIFKVKKKTSCAGMCNRDTDCYKYTLKQSVCTTYGDVLHVIGSGGSPLFQRREN